MKNGFVKVKKEKRKNDDENEKRVTYDSSDWFWKWKASFFNITTISMNDDEGFFGFVWDLKPESFPLIWFNGMWNEKGGKILTTSDWIAQ